MQNYEQRRDQEQLAALAPAIATFVKSYRPGRPTIVFLPGGKASELRRSTTPFRPGAPPTPFVYTKAWLDLEIFRDLPELKMQDDADIDHAVTVATGDVELLSVGLYEPFRLWSAACAFNVILFGWDWRRRLTKVAAFFGGHFLPALRAAVQQNCAADLLDDLTVVSHSFGGLLLHLWLSSGDEVARRVKRTVTVACPFYGYGGQIHRFFSGEQTFRHFYQRSVLAQVCSSMRGPYALMTMPHSTWVRDRETLGNDDFPLNAYPIVDAADLQTPVDPYDAHGSMGLVRYPTASWFASGELSHAKGILERITAPLPPAIAAKTHNWRGVRVAGESIVLDTCCRQTWRLVPPGFDPDSHDDPICDMPGPGDGTIPAWSAHLAHTPVENRRTFNGDLEHAYLMQHEALLDSLRRLIDPAAQETRQPDRGVIEPVANRADLDKLLREASTARVSAAPESLGPASGAARALLAYGPADRHALARRLIADLSFG